MAWKTVTAEVWLSSCDFTFVRDDDSGDVLRVVVASEGMYVTVSYYSEGEKIVQNLLMPRAFVMNDEEKDCLFDYVSQHGDFVNLA